MNLCFVNVRTGNHFMTELMAGVADAVADEGVPVSFVYDELPAYDPSTVYVIIPHEFFALIPAHRWPDSEQARHTIAFCVEMPGTQWFELTAAYAGGAGGIVSINRSATSELRSRGLAVEHFQLGYCRAWDTWRRDLAQERPIDVVYMGSTDDRRDCLLAGFVSTLWRRRTSMLIPTTNPRTERRDDYLVGAEKYARLRSSKALINLHRGVSRSLEWVRVLEAICNGCVVVSEHSLDYEPLVPGEHFVSGRPESLGLLADHILDRSTDLSEMSQAAYDFVRRELSMRSAVQHLLDMADELNSSRPRDKRGNASSPWNEPAPQPMAEASPLLDVPAELSRLRAAFGELAIWNVETRRQLQAFFEQPDEAWDADGVLELITTPAYERSRPCVSVIIPLYNHESEVVEALASVVGSEFKDYEVLVYDDCSTDESIAAVRSFFESRPWLSAQLFHGRINRGPSRGRNVLTRRARGEFLFMLDADNKIYPSTLGRLIEALERDPAAMFAYPIMAMHTAGVPSGLRSREPWDPGQLRHGNYIDTMALVRRRDLLEIGGYCEDVRLLGWEDYDLWCRCAEVGKHGVLVPELLGWYRYTAHSRDSFTNGGTELVLSLIRERSPTVFYQPAPD